MTVALPGDETRPPLDELLVETPTPLPNPAWKLERDAAARARGLDAELDWPQLVAQARALVQAAVHWPLSQRLQLTPQTASADTHATQLQCAARALENAAQFAPSAGREVAREAGLWAAAAFTLGGNLPSAKVVLERTFPRLQNPLTLRGSTYPDSLATLLVSFAPVLESRLRALCPDGNFEDWAACAREWPELEPIARACRQGTEELRTTHWLQQHGGALTESSWSDQLAAKIAYLLPPQVQALQNGLLDSASNALVALPPGTGKTWLGELFLLESLARRQNAESSAEATTQGSIAVFLVPYVALGRGVLQAFRQHLPAGVALHSWLGSARDESSQSLRENSQPCVIVATPERFDAALRANQIAREQLAAVVVDEAHLLGEGTRGVRLEGIITRLLQLAHQPRLLLLSAVVDSFEHLANWIGAQQHITLARWTPTARRLAFWRQQGALEWWGEIAGQGLLPLGDTRLPWPHSHLKAGEEWVRVRRLEPLTWENVAFLAHQLHLQQSGSILCLASTRRATRQLARALADRFPLLSEESGARGEAIAAIETRYRTLLPLARLLRHGVAWHNASLPSEIRSLIETAVTEGEIRALAATRTLAEGVDLPFSQTILADWLAWDEGEQKPLPAGLFRNIAGRCGRAGAFCEGDTLVFDNPLGPSQWTAPDKRVAFQHEHYLGPALHEPRSPLCAQGPLSPAIEAVFEAQLLALLAEGGDINGFYAQRCAPERFEQLLRDVLTHLQFHGWIELSEGTAQLTPRGQLLARCDLSPATGRRLLGALEALPRGDWSDGAHLARLNGYLWRSVGAVPEAGHEVERFFAPRSRFIARPADLETLGALWLEGHSVEAIFAYLGAQKSASFPNAEQIAAWVDGEDENGAKLDEDIAHWAESFDRWLDFVRAGLENWTPRLWRAAGVLSPLLENRPDLQQLDWNTAALLWATGVPREWAANTQLEGAPGGREVAAILGHYWPFSPKANDPLALEELKSENEEALKAAHRAMRAALKAAGGPHCVGGTNLKQLRDWLWMRAGLRK